MELNTKKLTVVHIEEEVLKLFDDDKEAINYANNIREYTKGKIEIKVDPLFGFLTLYTCDRLIQLKGELCTGHNLKL